MAFQMATSGSGWRLAGCLVQLGHEIAADFPQATCLGTVGDAAHKIEGDQSDHNPFVKDPHTGVGVVRAIDIGGPNAMLQQIRQRIWTLYAEQDPRLWELGYAKGTSDNLINNTGLPFKTHVDTGDAGHLHISVTRVGTAGYVSAIDSSAPWGFGAALSGGGTILEADVLDAQDITDIHNDAVSIWRAQEMSSIIQAACAKAVAAQPPITVDYAQLAAALINQLKAA